MNISIVGAANTKFGVMSDFNRETGEITDRKSIYALITEAGQAALADAGIAAEQVDGVWVGSCSPSMLVNQEHLAPMAGEIDPAGLRFKPMVRTESACASSSVALYDAAYAVLSGRFETALVIGVEKMNLQTTKAVTHALACSSYWPEEGGQGMTFPGLFAELAKAYRDHHQIAPEHLRKAFAQISALCYANGAKNPLAHFGPGALPEQRGLFTPEAILELPDRGKGANPMIADPLRLHDCSLVSDGAAALVITRSDLAQKHYRRAVELAGVGHATDRMPISRREKLYELTAGKVAVARAMQEAGVQVGDLDFAEVHDCFTINQILCTEALGLSKDGQGGDDYLAGRFGREDTCPVNLSGGLKAKGHPVGATGASMHALAFKQLVGEPIGLTPAKTPQVAACLNIGGSGVSNCASILRRIK